MEFEQNSPLQASLTVLFFKFRMVLNSYNNIISLPDTKDKQTRNAADFCA